MGRRMYKNYHQLILSSAVASLGILLSSCTDPKPSDQLATASPTAGPIAKTFGTKALELRKCQDIIDELSAINKKTAKFETPSHEFSLLITEIDPRDLKDKVKKIKAGTTTDAFESGKSKPSKWDFDAEIGKPTSTPTTISYQTAKISVTLKPKAGHNFRFVSAPDTIRAGDDFGYSMFCDLVVIGTTASFTAFYAPNVGSDFGSFNIGVVIVDKDTLNPREMKVFLDPEVKNDG